MKRCMTAFLLASALLSIPFQAPAEACGMAMPQPALKCGDCCATMKSCALPQQNPLQQAAAASAPYQFTPLIMPVGTELLSRFVLTATEQSFCRKRELVGHSPLKQAVLCTFLI